MPSPTRSGLCATETWPLNSAAARVTLSGVDLRAVSDAIRLAEAQEVAPRFGSLGDTDVCEKSPGELVTMADRACEALLSGLLRSIRDVPVVGEEAAAADPSLISLIAGSPAVWVVDPLDGTANFVEGRPEYSVMVAFVERGTTTAAWMWNPAVEEMAVAVRGSGAELNGVAVRLADPGEDLRQLSGVVKQRFLPPEERAAIARNKAAFGAHQEGSGCAGVDYPALVAGATDFLFYWRTLPWDHLPGVLFAQEAGGVAMRPNGAPYEPAAGGDGLIVAHPSVCDRVRRDLLG